MQPVLYGNWRSSSSQRVHIGLRLKEIAFTYCPVDLSTMEQEGPEFSALHPGRQVPILVDGTRVLSQSVAILEYLQERYFDHGVSLLPKNPEMRFATREITQYIASFMQPFLIPGATRRRLVNALGIADEPETAGAGLATFVRTHFTTAFAELERLLARQAGRFAIADQVSIADCMVIPQVIGGRRLGLNFDEYQSISRITENCLEMEAFALSMPEHQQDAPVSV